MTLIEHTHRPTTHFHPTMQESSHECDLIVAPRRIVHRLTQTPSSITTPGPIVTFGPILQLAPITAVGSTSEFPTTPGPVYSIEGFFSRTDFR